MSNIDFSQLIYFPETGNIFKRTNLTKPLGTINAGGYLVFKYQGKLRYVHRIAFEIYYGTVPKIIDHINGIKSDNRINNLREATAELNSRNRKAIGFTKPKQTKKWSASITINYKRKHLGYFDTPEKAKEAYLMAKRIYHPNAIVN